MMRPRRALAPPQAAYLKVCNGMIFLNKGKKKSIQEVMNAFIKKHI